MRNRYPGTCYYCGLHCEKGAGHFEKLVNAKGFRVIHVECVFFQRAEKLAKIEAENNSQVGKI